MLAAGEPSGDLHGAELARALKKARPELTLLGLGGRQMRNAGVEILADPTALAVVGLWEVLRHLGDFKQLFDRAVRILDERRPDLVVLIDYPGFNLRLAEAVKKRGIRLVYYVSPQVWAWNRSRVRTIRRLVDRMVVFFPFEEKLYRQQNVPVTFVGHPLLDVARASGSRLEILRRLGLEDALPVIGILPGSRQAEVRRILPALLAACGRLKEALPSTTRFLLIKAPHLPWNPYRAALRQAAVEPKVIERWDYNGLYACDLVLVASGTATLECALLERPMVIVYKTSWPTYLAARLLIRIPMIGLANVVAGKKIAPELIQHRASPRRIAAEARALWEDGRRRQAIQAELQAVRASLGEPGAAGRAAQAVLAELGGRPVAGTESGPGTD